MPYTPRILALAGSTRQASFNKQLTRVAAAGAAAAGAEVTVVDLRDFPLPIYDGDLEERDGLPENARLLKALFHNHEGLIISSPEYNSSISAVLKNTIDWVSRPVPGVPPLIEFRGKVAGLVSASPGALGGLRGLVHLRAILGNIGVLVLPEQWAISKAHEAFAEDGSLKDPGMDKNVRSLGAQVADSLSRLKG